MTFSLTDIKRYPYRKNDLLQGYDSADELCLEHMQTLDLDNKKILIINDHFGALSCGLKQYAPTTYTDSFVSMKGITLNSDHQIIPLHQLKELKGNYDYVLIQLPKNMSYFEDILATLTHHLHEKSMVICTGMVKHMAPTSFDLLQKYIGPTTTSLAKKKARLIFTPFQKEKITSPYPIELKIESFEKPFLNHSNLFSREKLDIGTRFLLEHIPQGPFQTILDLGCANGIIGIKAKQVNPESKIIFADESSMAVESAKSNYARYFSDEAEFVWANCFENQPENSVDLVLCNPPFHQGNTIGDFIAWQMFQDSFKSLRPGGILRVIGNSHLAYPAKLKKIFGNTHVVATNAKFVICDAVKR
jgi:23S rRNA (guanine1835-N2)-methyltransferase